VVGGFDNDVGTFYADDTFEGKPIRVRFLWRNLTTKPRWEQAFSAHGGKTWETNWVMDSLDSHEGAELRRHAPSIGVAYLFVSRQMRRQYLQKGYL
jgi:hypothetical protein